jgi:hypothetical protein
MFRPDRFARLARAHFAENARGYGWFLASGLLIHVVVSIFFAVSDDGMRNYTTEAQGGCYFIGLFVFSSIFAGRYFHAMGQRAPALLSLMRPATTFEKWLLALLVVVFLYPLAYSLLFYVVNFPDWILSLAAEREHLALAVAQDPGAAKYVPEQMAKYELFVPWRDFKDWRDPLELCLWFVAVQGFAVFGSLYFRNVALLKTVFAGLLFALVASLLTVWAKSESDLVLEYWDTWRSFTPVQLWAYGALWIITPISLWIAAYLALREREITA